MIDIKEKEQQQGSIWFKGSNNINRTGENTIKKKKTQHCVTEKSASKENKEKSIYQIVLEENKKLRGNIAKWMFFLIVTIYLFVSFTYDDQLVLFISKLDNEQMHQ